MTCRARWLLPVSPNASMSCDRTTISVAPLVLFLSSLLAMPNNLPSSRSIEPGTLPFRNFCRAGKPGNADPSTSAMSLSAGLGHLK